jgi:outer membrane protein assembly factor BamB
MNSINRNSKSKPAFLLIAVLICTLVLSGCRTGGATIPKGWAGAVTDGTYLFVGSMEGNIVSISLDDGDFVFEPMPLEEKESGGGFLGCSQASTAVAMYGSPVLNGDLVYVAGYNGRIYAFNKQTGASRWVYPRDGYLESIVGSITSKETSLFCIFNQVTHGSEPRRPVGKSVPDRDKIWLTRGRGQHSVYRFIR